MLKPTNPKYSFYEKKEKIGEGTFAVVYTGIAVGLDESKRKIAIKRIKAGLFQDGLDMSAIREIKYLKAVGHENIIELLDVLCFDEDGLNLVLEYLDTDLEMVIKNRNIVFSQADIKSWMLMILRGLNHCHQNFILHRDLKPNNLLLASDGVLKIADFGLARMFGDPTLTMTSQVVTRWYRSPELLLGAKNYGGAVDIWSCGCVFAELMLRTPYFAAETDIGQLNVILRARGTPTENEWPGMKSLPDYFEFTKYPASPSSTIFTAAGDDALNLLDALLNYDPLKRPTCIEALNRDYFSNQPRPTSTAKLAKVVAAGNLKEELLTKRKASDLEDGTPRLRRKLFY